MFRNDIHYVWCSEFFDGTAQGRYTAGSQTPPSSNPADIYRQLKQDVDRGDLHSAKIAEQKASFLRLAIDWEAAGIISPDEKDEIIYLVNNATSKDWKPLIYVIPQPPVASRLQLVPASQRAGVGREYIISDLTRCEFDIIEI
ncbi:hypothetical protein GMLC_33280 [Geomonas limicola]|uniref:Uncharacterized protein n=2 Tax=Geomonas limicola TaxID=2740186 RepID=A0A6V8NFB4_9BACT|nr:hypothetical protein GMLC_33280 [Geomonas limicola]